MSEEIDIRNKILEILNDYNKRKPNGAFSDKQLYDSLKSHTVNEIDAALGYLKESGRVRRITTNSWRITSPGIDFIAPSEFSRPAHSVQINVVVETFLVNIQQAIEQSELSPEEKATALDKIKDFLNNPLIAPFVGHGLLKMFGAG